ncbi:extensin family protein [Sphingomonas sp.]|uniref:extensin-like domain-containing protein n=1 Tax=Sphingomonas sp. TaxID=28214 RepID=UPI002C934B32|nr:extensin family protein [Sphingomonas sp.]HTG39364.1 extensin family protein [Sphingomonas sp.]
MSEVRRMVTALLVAAIVLAGVFAIYAWVRSRPQDMPWTELDLSRPVGLFTGRKLTALTQDFDKCRTLLEAAGVRHTVLAPVDAGASCGYRDAVRFASGGARTIDFRPAALGVSCPVAAGLAMWEWNVVQPAALRHFGERVTRIDHLGSYNCRRLYGRDSGDYSEHATADAVDVAGFRLSDGTRISVLNDWKEADDPATAAFLREVRDGACDLFSTVLSPDYNAAHADHFHLDQAERGERGWRACR